MEKHKPVDWDSDVSDSAYVDGGVPKANLIDDETHYAQTIAAAMLRAGIRLTPDLAQRWLSEGFINNHELEEIAKLVEGDY